MTTGSPALATAPDCFAIQLNGTGSVQIDRWTFSPLHPYQVFGPEAFFILTKSTDFLSLVDEGVFTIFIENVAIAPGASGQKLISETRTRIHDELLGDERPGGFVFETPDLTLPVDVYSNVQDEAVTILEDNPLLGDVLPNVAWRIESSEALSKLMEQGWLSIYLNDSAFGPGRHTLFLLANPDEDIPTEGDALSGGPAIQYLETLHRRAVRSLTRAARAFHDPPNTIQTEPQIAPDPRSQQSYLQGLNEQIEHVRSHLAKPLEPDAFPKAISALDPGKPLGPVVEEYLNAHVTPWMVFKHLMGWGRPHVSHTGTLTLFSHPSDMNALPIECRSINNRSVWLTVGAGGAGKEIHHPHHIQMLQRSSFFLRMVATIDLARDRRRIFITGRAVTGGYEENIDNFIPMDKVRDFLRILP